MGEKKKCGGGGEERGREGNNGGGEYRPRRDDKGWRLETGVDGEGGGSERYSISGLSHPRQPRIE